MSVYITRPPVDNKWLTKLYMRLNDSLSFSVNNNSVNQSLSASTVTKLNFSTVSYDTTGGYSTTTNTWTCLQDGIYSFDIVATLNGNITTGTIFNLSLYKNGSAIATVSLEASTTIDSPCLVLPKDLQLSKTDTITVYAEQTTSGSISILGNPINTYFQGKRVT